MRKMYDMINNKRGFTLIELIIVVAIIGILAAVAIPKFGNVQADARNKADTATAAIINNAIELYCVENNVTDMLNVTEGASGSFKITENCGVNIVIKVLEGRGYLKNNTKMNNPSTWTYDSDTNQVQ